MLSGSSDIGGDVQSTLRGDFNDWSGLAIVSTDEYLSSWVGLPTPPVHPLLQTTSGRELQAIKGQGDRETDVSREIFLRCEVRRYRTKISTH